MVEVTFSVHAYHCAILCSEQSWFKEIEIDYMLSLDGTVYTIPMLVAQFLRRGVLFPECMIRCHMETPEPIFFLIRHIFLPR